KVPAFSVLWTLFPRARGIMSNVEQMEQQGGAAAGATETESPFGGAQAMSMAQSIARKAKIARKAAANPANPETAKAAGTEDAAGEENEREEEEAAKTGGEVDANKGRPADIAARGFTGTATPLPFKTELEQSFKT